MTGESLRMADIAAALRLHAERWAIDVIGDKPSSRTGRQIRFGRQGSLAVDVAGPKAAIWCDHEAGVGGDLLDLMVHVRGGTLREAMLHAASWLRLEPGRPAPASAAAPRPAASEPRKTDRELLRRLSAEAIPPAGTPVQRYLESRNLHLPPGAPIRFHAACPRGAERLPAMLAVMSDPVTGRACGLHRTFLRPDGSGKADGQAKMMLGQAGIVRLTPDADVSGGLGIAEGIETALAIMQRAGWSPVWAAGSAGGIARFPVLPGIECLTVFPDADDKGASMKAADACAAQWVAARRGVRISMPPAGRDWHDAAVRVAA